MTLIHAIELDEQGHFICDAPGFDTESPTLPNWTADRAPNGMYQARYTGVRQDSGEWVGGEWVDDAVPDTLALAKLAKHGEINQWRNQQEAAGFEWGGYLWDSDDVAKSRLASFGPFALAGINPPPGYWTSANNTDVPMDAAQFVEMYTAMLTRGGQIHSRQREMKTQLDQAASLQAVEDFYIGW